MEKSSLLFIKTEDAVHPLFFIIIQTKKVQIIDLNLLAEREGFEPPVPRSTTVFKTAAIDHSAISPKLF